MPVQNFGTVHELLMSCPDDQLVRLRSAWKDVAAGEWKSAAHWLRNASKDGSSVWHEACAALAQEFEGR